jgi:hypothetical protein
MAGRVLMGEGGSEGAHKNPPSGPAQRLFQEPPAKSKFLAIDSNLAT